MGLLSGEGHQWNSSVCEVFHFFGRGARDSGVARGQSQLGSKARTQLVALIRPGLLAGKEPDYTS